MLPSVATPFLAWVVVSLGLVLGDLRVRVSPQRTLPEEDAADLEAEGAQRSMARLEREIGVFELAVGGNSSTDTVGIEFRWADGSVVSQLTDFRMQSQLLRVIIPGEIELGQPPYQAFCFVSSFSGDLVPPEAVMKLRQKNPTTIRIADEDRGEIVQDSPLLVDAAVTAAKSAGPVISSHIASFCSDAKESTYSSEHELYNILDASHGVKVSDISREAMKDSEHMPRCFSVEDARHPCICSLRVCLDWFPCALKYCKNHDGEGEHRCGIKTCRKCLTFRFPIKEKNLCLWDEV